MIIELEDGRGLAVGRRDRTQRSYGHGLVIRSPDRVLFLGIPGDRGWDHHHLHPDGGLPPHHGRFVIYGLDCRLLPEESPAEIMKFPQPFPTIF